MVSAETAVGAKTDPIVSESKQNARIEKRRSMTCLPLLTCQFDRSTNTQDLSSVLRGPAPSRKVLSFHATFTAQTKAALARSLECSFAAGPGHALERAVFQRFARIEGLSRHLTSAADNRAKSRFAHRMADGSAQRPRSSLY